MTTGSLILSVSTGFLLGAYKWPGEYLPGNNGVPAYSAYSVPGKVLDLHDEDYPFYDEEERQWE